MQKINLFEAPKKESLSQKFLDANFDVEISEDILNRLKDPNNSENKQELINSLFTKERQEKMVGKTNEDIEGRKVRYYRYMPWEVFLKILEKKKFTANDYIEDSQKHLSDKELKEFKYLLKDYCGFLIWQKAQSEKKKYEEEDQLEQMEIEDLLYFAFPDLTEKEINDLFKDFTLKKVRDFLEKNMITKFKKSTHTGGMYRNFLSYLSASCGSAIKVPRGNQVYLEMVIPDEDVKLQPNLVEGEKEVLIKQISLSNISRVYVGSEQFYSEIVENPDSNYGEFIKKNPQYRYKAMEGIGRWRWDEKIEDYLPVSLRKKFKPRKS